MAENRIWFSTVQVAFILNTTDRTHLCLLLKKPKNTKRLKSALYLLNYAFASFPLAFSKSYISIFKNSILFKPFIKLHICTRELLKKLHRSTGLKKQSEKEKF